MTSGLKALAEEAEKMDQRVNTLVPFLKVNVMHVHECFAVTFANRHLVTFVDLIPHMVGMYMCICDGV